MKNNNKFLSPLGFTDILLNILMGFAFLFIASFMLINPEKPKNENFKARAEFIITLEWDDDSKDDIDLWIKDPLDGILSFQKKEVNFMHLDRDDMGTIKDVIMTENGLQKVKLNREVATIRGINSGWYIVNAHVYAKLTSKKTKATIEVIKLNPYKMIHKKIIIFEKMAQENTIVSFKIDKKGKVLETEFEFKKIFNVPAYYNNMY